MLRALKLIEETRRDIDIYLELRDARVPISSKNPEFDKLIVDENKKKIIIFNKYDLCNKRMTNKLIEKYR